MSIVPLEVIESGGFANVTTSVFLPILNLICRLVHDSLQIHARLLSESGQLVEWSLFLAIQVTAGITTFAMYINFISLFEIIFFVQRLFWKTARLLRAISNKTHRIIEIIILIANVVVVIIGVLVVVAVSALYAIKKFEIISNNYLTYAFVASFIAIFIILIFLSSLIITSGILVMRTIKQTTRNVTQSIRNTSLSDTQNSAPTNRASFEIKSFEKRVQSPFKITFGLLLGLLLCILLEIISLALASTVTSSEDFKAIWHFFNCLGVLIYAVLLMLLFYPMFLDSENALKEIEKRNELMNSSIVVKIENSANSSQISLSKEDV
ncbi:predicted protein [Naegleria gruberi]|uniref:Predicted protein n=1 Tax=Naegleria gruberi TaxID=5762 RepID=D2VBM6_NAEGR|nr:uncharacterized protein NAEGRDRAFT_66269 [Naegleria gruberi]EFC45936.1 predicted protein [Naegleria gruberi]|eukprot:XP_002678680.1 predicted protein [Naegleria gruberi strain NEG-M]